MKTFANQTSETPATIVCLIPADLGEWLSDASLAAAARASAEIFYWIEAGDDDDHPPFGGCACPLRKLALFTYCCARGIDAPEDIAARLAVEHCAAAGDDCAPCSLAPSEGKRAGVRGQLNDQTLRELTTGAVFPADKLRLFRAHNSELIKLCLARVLEQAWTARFGKMLADHDAMNACRSAVREFFAVEAARRFRRAIDPDQRPPAQPLAPLAPAADNVIKGARTPRPRISQPAPKQADEPSVLLARAAAYFIMAFVLFLTPARAEETLPPFKLDGKGYTNAVVIEANPVDVLIRQEELGYKRLKRQDMPVELKDRFPYNAKEVEEYEKQKITNARAQREQQRRDAYAALVRQETELQAKLRQVEKQLSALQKELDVMNVSARGKPRSAARQEADQMRVRKQDIIRHLEQLRDQCETVRKLQAQYR